jgi:hypothetical protein
MSLARTRTVLAAALSGSLGATLLQCAAGEGDEDAPSGHFGQTGGSGNTGGSSSGGSSSGGSSAWGGTGANGSDAPLNFDGQYQDYSSEQFFLDDPPPGGCDGGGIAKKPGGTPECPDDKNLEGCPCTEKGKKVPCWPGYRKHQNRGACKDGETECLLTGESTLEWGPCIGYQGIDPVSKLPLGTSGKAACGCFSGGYWRLDNTSPCFYFSSQTVVMGGVSTIIISGGGDAGVAQADCPGSYSLPGSPWSPNTVKADCTGYFKLCYTLKAYSSPNKNGDAGAQAGDCVMKVICTEDHYDVADVEQAFPDLPAWITDTPTEIACAQAFVDNGGYAEMSVDGESDECEPVSKIFQHVDYCPLKCNDPAHQNDPECINCTNGGGGPF